MSYLRTFDSWADGVKQTLNPDATSAGFNVGAHTADPSALVNGDVWYQSTANELRFRINGATVSLTSVGGSPPFLDTNALVKGSADATKLLRFEVDGFTTGTTRVITPPNADITLAGTNLANTFTPDQIITGALTAGNALFNITATTGVLKLANGTDPAADPTAATTQWAVGGEWQYRSSAASEGAGQTNRVHNRAAEVVGAGTDYALTMTNAKIDFGTTDPTIILPTAGTYYVEGQAEIIASALSATDLHFVLFRNVTDSVFVLPGAAVALGASFSGQASFSVIVTITASKTFELWASNSTAARGIIQAVNTSIKYIRLY